MSSILSTLDEVSLALLSPCSSGGTYVESASAREITVLLPNQIDKVFVLTEELENFVAANTNTAVDLRVTHLLLYLFAKNVDPSARYINNLKLIHRGRFYTVQRPQELQASLPLISEIVQSSPTFQLFVTQQLKCAPMAMPVREMVQKVAPPDPWDTPSVTYAEAMVKLIRKTSRRLSISSLASATRSSLRDSATDVEDDERPSLKFRNSIKRIFKRHGNCLHNHPDFYLVSL